MAPVPVSLRVMAWVAGAILLVDQLSKYYVVHTLRLDRVREIDIWPPWLNLRMAWNLGVNFGLFSSSQDVMRWVLIAVALGVCVWVFLWVRRARPGPFAQTSAGLLIGGALGNVIDRVAYGAVADFLNMSLPNWQNPFSFNVADIAIFAGAIGLILQPPQRGDKTRDVPEKSG
ncbi:signal peptidase II [Paracoccus aurantiacus]|uniref:Lipoprotein signal peptidase n=2 Tax=Paracoccus aurantiacus TaxID=2599412 RepID=A0A5C6S6Q9_9RHOB|nr:signal peptidase II [Paracoccus aurantiacus]